jgi:hypothetical protein
MKKVVALSLRLLTPRLDKRVEQVRSDLASWPSGAGIIVEVP